jgi:hypothetical protein
MASYSDREGNVWVTDGQDNGTPAPGAAGPGAPIGPAPGATKGHQVFKFGPDGQAADDAWQAGRRCRPDYFYQPNDVLVAPSGDIFVSEGHGAGNNRGPEILQGREVHQELGSAGNRTW